MNISKREIKEDNLLSNIIYFGFFFRKKKMERKADGSRKNYKGKRCNVNAHLFELIQRYRGVRPAGPDVEIRLVPDLGIFRRLGVLLILRATILPRALRSRRAFR